MINDALGIIRRPVRISRPIPPALPRRSHAKAGQHFNFCPRKPRSEYRYGGCYRHLGGRPAGSWTGSCTVTLIAASGLAWMLALPNGRIANTNAAARSRFPLEVLMLLAGKPGVWAVGGLYFGMCRTVLWYQDGPGGTRLLPVCPGCATCHSHYCECLCKPPGERTFLCAAGSERCRPGVPGRARRGLRTLPYHSTLGFIATFSRMGCWLGGTAPLGAPCL